ncbi:type II toxin-antitoxin system RelE/ParE family toxin [Yoonia sp. 2307UL14-13]|uniref:type II toxin-antitoxin system RelE/ParE family toxin n=1 Tax=Yoonia sp. 2307UL14-13 TaxID=3126506 RepID=UPI0030A0E256
MASYKLSQRAEDDLVRVHQYGVRQWGVVQADAYFYDLLGQLDMIGREPLRFPRVDEILKGHRRSVFRSHAMYFVMKEGVADIRAIIGSQDTARLR